MILKVIMSALALIIIGGMAWKFFKSYPREVKYIPSASSNSEISNSTEPKILTSTPNEIINSEFDNDADDDNANEIDDDAENLDENLDGELFKLVEDALTKPQVLRKLIQSGADVNAVNEDGQTVLMRCAENNSNPENFKLVRILVKAGAKVNAKNEDGMTALIFSAKNGDPKVIKALLTAGAKINSKTNLGYTALMYAAMNNNYEAVKVLINAGANLKARNCIGDTALDLARSDDIKNILRNAVPKIKKPSKIKRPQNSGMEAN